MSAARFPASLSGLRSNILAGLVVGIIALPLSIALAVAVGAPPVAGLYTAAFAGGVASIFGGSEFNITGPTAALVPILSQAVLVHGPEALPTLAVLAGVLLLIMGALKVGRLIRYVPGLVVVGFTTGIALSIAFGQLNNFLNVSGTDPDLRHFHEKTFDTFANLGTVGLVTPALGLLSLAILIGWARLPRLSRVPAPLVAVVLISLLVWSLNLETPTIASQYGELPRGFPRPTLDVFDASLAFDLLPIAVSIAVLGSVESLLSAVVADGMASTGARHNPNRELIGQGLANLASPVMGGIPATAAIARTGAGIRSGATSRLTGIVHALTVLAATLALGGLAGHIPLTVLAAILLVVAWNIAEVPEVTRLLRHAPREDLIVLTSTIAITLFFDLSYAVGFGMLVSTILLIRRMVQDAPAVELRADENGRIRKVSPELADLIESRPDVACYAARGVLSFHSAAALEYRLNAVDERPLILRMRDVHYIDTTGLLTLEAIIEHRQRRRRRIILTAMRPETHVAVERFGLLDKLGSENVFEHTRCAIMSIDGGETSQHRTEQASASTAS